MTIGGFLTVIKRPLRGSFYWLILAVLAHLCEALAAVHGTIRLGLERYTSLAAAACANSGEVLSRAAGSILASVTAGLATLRLVLESSLSIELLLTSGEHELGATLLAN